LYWMLQRLHDTKWSARGSKRSMTKLLLAALLLTVLQPTFASEAQTAASDLGEPLLPLRLDAHGSLTWDGFMGFGARADYRILEQGVMGSAHDELAISAGADVILLSLAGSDPLDILPTVALQWNLGVSDRFAFYPELGIAARIDRDGWQGVYPNVGFGGRYYLWRSVSIMGRFGWPLALSAGATF